MGACPLTMLMVPEGLPVTPDWEADVAGYPTLGSGTQARGGQTTVPLGHERHAISPPLPSKPLAHVVCRFAI